MSPAELADAIKQALNEGSDPFAIKTSWLRQYFHMNEAGHLPHGDENAVRAYGVGFLEMLPLTPEELKTVWTAYWEHPCMTATEEIQWLRDGGISEEDLTRIASSFGDEFNSDGTCRCPNPQDGADEL
jgi:hypothetical protein